MKFIQVLCLFSFFSASLQQFDDTIRVATDSYVSFTSEDLKNSSVNSLSGLNITTATGNLFGHTILTPSVYEITDGKYFKYVSISSYGYKINAQSSSYISKLQIQLNQNTIISMYQNLSTPVNNISYMLSNSDSTINVPVTCSLTNPVVNYTVWTLGQTQLTPGQISTSPTSSISNGFTYSLNPETCELSVTALIPGKSLSLTIYANNSATSKICNITFYTADTRVETHNTPLLLAGLIAFGIWYSSK